MDNDPTPVVSRRLFSKDLLVASAASVIPSIAVQAETAHIDSVVIPQSGWITDVEGITVGHWDDTRRPTGCTVVLCEPAGTCGVDVRGGWPGTRLTDALDPVKGASNTILVNAIALSGGSNYGLATATGVEQFLRERYVRKLGADAKNKPIAFAVPAAIIYDLHPELGDWTIAPTAESGYQACLAAAGGPVQEGNHGVGAGVTVGKMFGIKQAMKSGVGTSSIKIGGTGIVVGAIAAVNAIGDIVNPRNGQIIAGARTEDGKNFVNEMEQLRSGKGVRPFESNTTIAVVATNATFTKTEMNKIAQMASAGLARTINPVFTTLDGDTVFAVSTRRSTERVEVGAIGAVAAEALAEAILRAIVYTEGIKGFLSYGDLHR
jgi:L-aminopeptidase/D-esterase-like protein